MMRFSILYSYDPIFIELQTHSCLLKKTVLSRLSPIEVAEKLVTWIFHRQFTSTCTIRSAEK